MKCPVCTTVNLNMTDRQGLEIDYCPQCRGIWLDRGELDKLIERAQVAPPASPRASVPQPPPVRYEDGRTHHAGYQDYRARKKKSFLGEIFDFD